MKRALKSILTFVLVVCGVFAVEVFTASGTVQAASEYEELFGEGYEPGDVVKSGKYYFYCSSSDYKVYMSNKRNSGYKVTKMPYQTFSNGKQAYYIRDNALYRFIFSSKKETRLKKLSAKGSPSWYISLIYSGKIYITRGCFDEWSYSTYLYNISKKTFKKIKKDCSIICRSGKYVIAQNEYCSDVSPYKMTLYKLTANGMKKLKVLTKAGFGSKAIGKKWYYVSYPDIDGQNYSMNRAVLYKCNLDGKKNVKVAELTADVEYDMVLVQEITSEYCIYYTNEGRYKYTYATGEKEEIVE